MINICQFLYLLTENRKGYSANDVLIRLIQNWKQSLDNHKYRVTAKPIVY